MQVCSAKARSSTTAVSWWRSQINPSKRKTDTPFRCTDGDCLVSLVSTDHLILSFQLSICPNVMVPAGCSVGCKIVYFGCCQNLNISWLYPILCFQFFPQAWSLIISVFLFLQRWLWLAREYKGLVGKNN